MEEVDIMAEAVDIVSVEEVVDLVAVAVVLVVVVHQVAGSLPLKF